MLSLGEYLDTQRAIRNEVRFRAQVLPVGDGPHSARELENALDVPSNNLHYHLDELVDVGPVSWSRASAHSSGRSGARSTRTGADSLAPDNSSGE